MGSLSVTAIPKILVLLLLICLTRVAAGSCLSYGHSCWGGHGKRSGSLHVFNPLNIQKQNDDWYFSKFFKLLKEKPIDSSPLYNGDNKDFGILDKLIKNGHLKRSIGEPVEGGVPRDQNAEEFGNETDREEPENNDVNTEELSVAEEDKSSLNSKPRLMQKAKLSCY